MAWNIGSSQSGGWDIGSAQDTVAPAVSGGIYIDGDGITPFYIFINKFKSA